MLNQFSRTELILGKEGIEKLKKSKVAIFGLGGVGSYVLEGLVRAGVENFLLVDNDIVSITNINRQIIATHKTVGKDKVEVARERALEINPNVIIEEQKIFFTSDTSNILDDSIDYVVDAIDTVSSKIELISLAKKMNIPIISAMGTGNKLEPTKLEVTDISKTSMCPLAKVVRKNLRNIGINHVKVVYSKEEPIVPDDKLMKETIKEEGCSKQTIPASVSFVPSVAGLIIAGEVVKDIVYKKGE